MIPAASRKEKEMNTEPCHHCSGTGLEIIAVHAHDCTGDKCSIHCPVPEQVECSYCGGYGEVETEPESVAPAAGEE